MYSIFIKRVHLLLVSLLINMRIGNHKKLAEKATEIYEWIWNEEFVRYCGQNDIIY